MPKPIPVYIVPQPTNWLAWLIVVGGGLMLLGLVVRLAIFVAIGVVGLYILGLAFFNWPKATSISVLIALGGWLGGSFGVGIALAVIALLGGLMWLGDRAQKRDPANPKLLTQD